MAPVMFTLGWIDVPSFTALMALALGVGLLLTWVQARWSGLAPADVLDVAFAAVLLGVIAARAAYVAINWGYFVMHTDEIAQLWLGGLTWQGGLFGGVIGAAVVCAWRRLSVRQTFDALTPGLMAGAVFGWLACYLGNVAYGRQVFPGDTWWFLAADLPDIYGLSNPRLSTQLLGAAWAAVCLLAAFVLSRRSFQKPESPLSTFAVTIALYSAGMLMLGFARGDAAPMIGVWRLDQVIDAGIVAVASVYSLVAVRRPPPVRQ
jgi:phosphatidylglycerol:prolipoprotein diacylglycerol transferase